MYEVADPLQLPFAAKCLVTNANVSVVVAIGFLVQDSHWCSKEVRRSLLYSRGNSATLMELAAVGGVHQ